MAKTEWFDVSEHNGQTDWRKYRQPFAAFRVCDGTYVDQQYVNNMKGVHRVHGLIGFFAYVVFPRSVGWSSWQSVFDVYTGLLGKAVHRPRLIIMQDVERWDRRDYNRDVSHDIEMQRQAFVHWLFHNRPAWQRRTPALRQLYWRRDERRVIGYGNRYDLVRMSQHVKWRNIVLADYSESPTPAQFLRWRVVARQYTNQGSMAPHGRVDLNRATLTPRQLAKALGLGRVPPIK